MAIEVTEVKGTPKFPRAYRADNGLVVLFGSAKSGMVIDSGGSSWKEGKHHDSLFDCRDGSHWKPVNLSITHD